MGRFTKTSAILLTLAALATPSERPGLAQIQIQRGQQGQRQTQQQQSQPQRLPLNLRILAPDGTPLAKTDFTFQMKPLGDNSSGSSGGVSTTEDGLLNTTYSDLKPGRYSLFLYSPKLGYALLPNVPLQPVQNAETPIIDVPLQPGATLQVAARETILLPGRRLVERPIGGAEITLNWIISERERSAQAKDGAAKETAGNFDWLANSTTGDAQVERKYFSFPLRQRVTREGSGELEIDNLPPGRYQVQARSLSTYLPATALVDVLPGEENDLRLYLANAEVAPLRLTIQDEDDKPIKNTQMHMNFTPLQINGAPLQSDGEDWGWPFRTIRTDAKGQCMVYPLRPGRWKVSAFDAFPPSFLVPEVEVEVPLRDGKVTLVARPAPAPPPNAAPPDAPAVFIWPERVATNIRILAPNGAPLAGERINIDFRGENGSVGMGGTLTTDAGFVSMMAPRPDGRGGFTAGRYKIFVHVPELGAAYTADALVSTTGAPVVSLQLQHGHTLRVLASERLMLPGRNRRSIDQPVGEAKIQVRLLPDEEMAAAEKKVADAERAIDFMRSRNRGFFLTNVVSTRDGDGVGEFKNLPPGRYEVTIKSLNEYAPITETVEVGTGPMTTLPVYLTRGGAAPVHVRVQDENGDPLRDSDVVVTFSPASSKAGTDNPFEQRNNGMSGRIAHTDRRGECTIYPVALGRWRVRASWMSKDRAYFVTAEEPEIEVLPEGGEVALTLKKPGPGKSYSMDEFWAQNFR